MDESRRPGRRRASVREMAVPRVESLGGYPLDVDTHRTLWTHLHSSRRTVPRGF